MPGEGRCGIMPGFGRGPPGPAAGRGPPAPGPGREPAEGRGPPAPGPGRGPPGPDGPGRGPPAAGPGRGPPAAGPGRGAPPDGAGRGALLKGLLPGRGAGRGPGRGPGAGAAGRAPGVAPPAGPGCGAPGRGPLGAAGGCWVGALAAGACGAGAVGRGPGTGAPGRAVTGRGPGVGAPGARVTGGCGAGAGADGAAGVDGADGAAATGACGAAGALGRGPGRGAAWPPPLPVLLPSASRSRRATGASTVEEADFTNSPCSLSLASTVLLSTPNSLASSCTRALPGTGLLFVRPAACPRDLVVSTACGWSSGGLHGLLIRRRPALDVRTRRVRVRLCWCGCRSCVVARPGPAPRGRREGRAEDVVPERTGLHRGAAASGEAQRPGEGPASLRCAQALRGGVQRGAPAGEPPTRVGDEGPVPRDDAQQVGDRSALPAAHTGAHRDRRFGHPAL